MRRFSSVLPLALPLAFPALEPITLEVDAREAPRRILHVRETLPAGYDARQLRYAKWIPGEHGPTGPLTDLAGPRVTSGGKPVAWRRDLADLFLYRLETPAGGALELSFDFLLPPVSDGFSSGSSSSANLFVLSWNQALLYPDSSPASALQFTASVVAPAGWKAAGALDCTGSGRLACGTVSLERLIDSPVLLAKHLREVELTPGPNYRRHRAWIAADGEAALAAPESWVAGHRALVREATALFGAPHYAHYDFLVTLSDEVAHFGLEHHESSDDRLEEKALTDDDARLRSLDLLPHEFVHSWNGKFRRPAGLATGDYASPMKGDLLWVYEGLTEYWGKVLAARAGLWAPEQAREELAGLAAWLDHTPGRAWRPLQDTADEAQLLYAARSDWEPLRRGTDFYDEGVLLWLEADARIRMASGGKKSLDDFSRAFYGGEASGPRVLPYGFEEVAAGLDAVSPADWKGLLRARLDSTAPGAPLEGLAAAGWRLVYSETPNTQMKAREESRELLVTAYSLGLVLGDDGTVRTLLPGSPADRAGLAPGMKIVAVDGRAYKKKHLRAALARAKRPGAGPLEIIAVNGEFFSSFKLDWHEGERYPHLERIPGTPDLLSAILAPRAPEPAKKK